ncbi:Permease of the drug/metabolite transporter (DMT) superfamily [Salinihabitans flavidus]|uniref:Permease of the drug/metabolite transporter (DMT) superfamily n=1 Tax=Salinihabitans flavidus TaxID=569882 RepID=A0A1H8ND38_9RHOB|nr:DMT family transporter [Salinihabitans flavidus]SEO27462.1 Permease of the drug/metabolite transporter (DMT) superfamily [Salinihabitans flavidus]
MTPKTDMIKGALWMIGAIASFTSMAIAGREVSFELDTFEIMMYRSFVGLAIMVAVGAMAGRLHEYRTARFRTHVTRNIFHFAGQNFWFYSISVIPLAQVFAIEFTSPLWVVVLSPLVLGERLTPVRALSALIGFAGILIVTRPSVGTFEFGQLTAAFAAIGFAGSALVTRRLTWTDSTICILFYMTLLQSVFGIVCAFADLDVAVPSATAIPWLIVIGLAGLAAHFCITTALTFAPAAVVMPIDFGRLPVIALVGFIFYAETVSPWVLVGAVVIFAGNYLNIRAESRAPR